MEDEADEGSVRMSDDADDNEELEEAEELLGEDDVEEDLEEGLEGDEFNGRPLIGSRAEKSLGLLTQRFLKLLQTARNGIVDLNTVCFDIWLNICNLDLLGGR